MGPSPRWSAPRPRNGNEECRATVHRHGIGMGVGLNPTWISHRAMSAKTGHEDLGTNRRDKCVLGINLRIAACGR